MNDLKKLFSDKIAECHQNYKAQWEGLETDELIDRAEEIAAVQRLAAAIPEVVTDTEMEYLMKFKNPLEIVVDRWLDDSAYNSPLLGEQIESVIYQIVDKGDADSIYETESDEAEEPTIELT